MQIKIVIPVDHTAEIRYVIDVLFGDVLNLDYQVETRIAITDVIIQVGEKKLIFQDHFFSKFLDRDNYLDEKFFPPKVRFLEYGDDLVPILYGHDYFFRDERMTVCGLDIFSSLFFLLTAWEENARKYIFDQYRYFPFNASWIWKNGLHEHDVLKEYVDLLLSLLEEIGFDISTVDYSYSKPVIYLLVEDLQYFKNDYQAMKWSEFLLSPVKYMQEKKKLDAYKETKKDPYDNLYLWWKYAKENKHNLHLMLLAGASDEQVEKVKVFAHKKQLHVGAYISDPNSLGTYKQMAPIVIDEFNLTLQEKWRLLQEHQITSSINASFRGVEGNRCGISLPFRTFDILERKPMGVIEMPIVSSHFFNSFDEEENEHKTFVLANAARHSVLISNLLFSED